MTIRKLKTGAFVELECKHFVGEGLGLSYLFDESLKEKIKPHVFFIWGVLPGERFIARISKVKSKHAHGVLARREDIPAEMYEARNFVHPVWALSSVSDERVAPACDNFLRCGGCRMQHLPYEKTLEHKTSWLANQLRHHKVPAENITVYRQDPENLYHYRNHVQVHINKFGVYGFYEPFSYRTRAFPEHGCLLFHEKELRESFPKYPVEVRAARIRQNADGHTVFTEFNSKAEATTFMRNTVAWPEGSATHVDFPVTSFFQVNLGILPAWLDLMAEYLGRSGARNFKVLELFSGFGFISRMLSQRFSLQILAADLLTREQVKTVQMANAAGPVAADFWQNYHKVDLFLPQKIPADFLTAVENFKPEVLLVNPPRAGFTQETWLKLRETALAGFSGPIIYSSCNAATMARDLGYLAAEGFAVRDIQLFDFFPWTQHFETVAFCQKV